MRAKRIAIVSLTLVAALAIATSTLQADGGTVRASERSGERLVTVFTSPTPLRAGLIDVSVLLLDANTGTPLSDVPVIVEAVSADSRRRFTRGASKEAATNKLMCAAELELTPGKWHLNVFVGDSATSWPIGFDVDVAEPIAPWIDTGLWIAWPFAAIGLFAVHRMLVGRRSRKPARPLVC
jgi:hypothetical protein